MALKKYSWGIICILFLVAGCQETETDEIAALSEDNTSESNEEVILSEDNSSESKEDAAQPEENNSGSNEDGSQLEDNNSENDENEEQQKNEANKEEDPSEDGIAIEEFEADIREEFLVHNREGEPYTVYLFSDNEKEFTQEDTWVGAEAGDTITEGNYQFALRAPESKFVEVQSESLDNWTFNHNRMPYYTLKNDPDLLFFQQDMASNIVETVGFMVDEGELHSISYPDLHGNSSTYKSIGDQQFQHYWYNNQSGTWTFQTIQLNVPNYSFEVKETFEFSGDDFYMGEDYASRFNSEAEFFVEEKPDVQYNSLLNDEFFENQLVQGYLMDSELHLGQIVEDVEAELGPALAVELNFYGPGADYYIYEDYSYLVSQEENHVIEIATRPHIIGNPHYKDVRNIFGKPTSEGFSELDFYYHVDFNVFDRRLTFIFEEKNSEALGVSVK
ncbi:hypothetical protein [Salipaludibacillus aurantiacus]|uniref:DUF4309 domain-containing protein n=1 Tax=Salipaludibacillus aurantiacus TaxID=1601833 RepID=A0A1H9UGU8_9BACI|nr:hypothetical protein [Salipaludibacillus aurantiacus]SES08498.1 hypothetical protein SAMN05518684_107199 [Salipaludibacillus aurantiacus]